VQPDAWRDALQRRDEMVGKDVRLGWEKTKKKESHHGSLFSSSPLYLNVIRGGLLHCKVEDSGQQWVPCRKGGMEGGRKNERKKERKKERTKEEKREKRRRKRGEGKE
jgi:hypothetical protein